GVVGCLISNSELTIKGPAAGLIVIAVGCVVDFGFTWGKDPQADFAAYRLALAVGVAAALVQIAFAVFRTGLLGEVFPTSTVHGMRAAIGVIIMLKQLPVALGSRVSGSPLELLADLPRIFRSMNPEVALIGLVSLVILFGKPLIRKGFLAKVPAQLIVVLA